MINDNIKKVLIELNQRRENGIDNIYLTELIQEYSKELGISYITLYNLLLNKEYLIEEVNKEINITDIKLETLGKEIEELKLHKKNISSIICEIYGHVFTNYKGTNIQTCKLCGKQELIPDDTRKLFLNKWHKH